MILATFDTNVLVSSLLSHRVTCYRKLETFSCAAEYRFSCRNACNYGAGLDVLGKNAKKENIIPF